MKGLTLTIVTPKIQSVNYGETIGNVSTLKKLSTGTDNPKKLITYFSDKAIKYDVKRIGRDQFCWNLMNKSVVDIFVKNYHNGNFDHDNFLKEMIATYEEFDLFGGMFADIGNVSGEIKQTVANENDLNSLINGLSDDTDITSNNRATKVKNIKQFLKLLSDNSGKTVSIERDSFSIDEIKSDASKLSELKNKLGRRKIEIKIGDEDKKKKDVEDIIKAIETIQNLMENEITYKKSLTIEDTNKLKRSQPVRFSNGYSISEFTYDMNLLNDIDAYNRYIQHIAGQKKQSLVYPEEHYSHYTYTLTIDLDRIGAVEKVVDGRIEFEPIVDPAIRAKRVNDVIAIILLFLNREIKGRNEELAPPVFLIGGVYDVKHPFFANVINFWEQDQKLHFKASDIKKVLDMYEPVKNITSDTYLYYDKSFVVKEDNEAVNELKGKSINVILTEIKKKISDYYIACFNNHTEALIRKLKEVNKINDEEFNKFNEELRNLQKKQEEVEKSLEMLKKERTEFVKKLYEKLNEN